MERTELARKVDHTLLKPEATGAQIDDLCRDAIELGTITVCVNGLWVAAAAANLAGNEVGVCAVVGFPLGAMDAQAVAAETARAVADGAVEIDMVIPVGYVRENRWSDVHDYIAAVRAELPGRVLKVILETALLDDGEIVASSKASVDAGADFVKTSTGFNPAGGATLHAVELLRRTVGPDIGVKAAGGIRTLDDALAMLQAGASRLGMSSTRAVLAELPR